MFHSVFILLVSFFLPKNLWTHQQLFSVVCDGSVAVSEDGLPTQEPTSRAVAERSAPQPAQPPGCHAGPCPLWYRESPLTAFLLKQAKRRGPNWIESSFFSSKTYSVSYSINHKKNGLIRISFFLSSVQSGVFKRTITHFWLNNMILPLRNEVLTELTSSFLYD